MSTKRAGPPDVSVATGKEELISKLNDLKERFERGEIRRAAMRVYNADGTWEDVVLGATGDADRDEALEELRRAFRAAH